jgi:hypothetical protein
MSLGVSTGMPHNVPALVVPSTTGVRPAFHGMFTRCLFAYRCEVVSGVRREFRDMSWVCRCGCQVTCAGGVFDQPFDLTPVEPRSAANRHESDLSGVRRDGRLRFFRQRFWRDHVVFGQRALSYLAARFTLLGRAVNWVSGTPPLRPSRRDMT